MRHEGEVHTLLTVHHDGVHEVVFIETDGPTTDGADEAALQEPDVIIVDIDIGEDVGQDGSQHVSRIEKLLNTAGIHTFDDGFFAFGTFAVDGLRRRLLDGDGEDHLVGLGRYFHLVFEE